MVFDDPEGGRKPAEYQRADAVYLGLPCGRRQWLDDGDEHGHDHGNHDGPERVGAVDAMVLGEEGQGVDARPR